MSHDWIFKMILKTPIQMRKGIDSGIQISGKLSEQILKSYGSSWPKFEQVSEKVPTARTLELLAFDQ